MSRSVVYRLSPEVRSLKTEFSSDMEWCGKRIKFLSSMFLVFTYIIKILNNLMIISTTEKMFYY